MKLVKLFAASALVLSTFAAFPARADTWGCEVLLCLSNPAGPMAVAQCVPPITRLYRAIFKWRPDPFPTCTMSSGADSSAGGNYAYVAPPSYYDACPAGTTPVPSGVYGATGRLSTPAEIAVQPRWMASQPITVLSGLFAGIGDGNNSASYVDGVLANPPKTCGANLIGTVDREIGSGDAVSTVSVNVYDRVVIIDPAADTFNINVMINGALFRNIRPFSQSASRPL